MSATAASIAQFGDAFVRRLFTDQEIAYAREGVGLEAERLAARFAAKEAVIKALQLSEAGIDWRDIEVVKLPDGDCEIELHGEVALHARDLGAEQVVLSLTHDADWAGAAAMVLLALPHPSLLLEANHEYD